MFEVLAEPHRRRILDLLRTEDLPVGALVAALGISQPGVSKHLRVLRAAGLVEVIPDAQRRVYRLLAEPLREIDEWLAPYRRCLGRPGWTTSSDIWTRWVREKTGGLPDDRRRRLRRRCSREAGSRASG